MHSRTPRSAHRLGASSSGTHTRIAPQSMNVGTLSGPSGSMTTALKVLNPHALDMLSFDQERADGLQLDACALGSVCPCERMCLLMAMQRNVCMAMHVHVLAYAWTVGGRWQWANTKLGVLEHT